MEVTAPHMFSFVDARRSEGRNYECDGFEEELRVEKFDTCVEENGANHHTDKFELMGSPRSNGKPSQLVVRRGQEFLVKLICNRPFNGAGDTLSLVLAVQGIWRDRISHGHGTLVYMHLETGVTAVEDDQDTDWSATLLEANEIYDGRTELVVSVKTSPNASVSQWTLAVNVESKGFKKRRYSLDQPFYLLFNPWCAEDSVYLDDENKRREYVLEDMTMIWQGTYNNFYPQNWKLGQYEEIVLDSSLWLLGEVARLSATYRGNPIKVCRALSGVVNWNEDYGVLEGKWKGRYDGGTAPTAWTSSVQILQEYYQQKGLQARAPVRYGQCWVFAGLLGTLCRALGIPCRIVTNFESAHDSESSLTIDNYVNDEGNSSREGDSVWNFHVWNEVWMKRPDLASDHYDGWQVIDGTPQEFSDGMHKLGPAPVAAIKQGRVNLTFDCDFVFTEVNADQVFWRYRGAEKPLELISRDTSSIGQFISTKAVGSDDREDITHNYKCREQSAHAKRTMLRALKLGQSSLTKHYLKLLEANEQHKNSAREKDIEFELELNDQVFVGESFTILLRIKNVSDADEHTVTGRVNLDHILYTGKSIKSITSYPFSLTVEPNGQEVVEIPILFDEYYEPGMDEAVFKVSSFATIEADDNGHFSQQTYSLRKPTVQLVLGNEPKLRASLKVTASFQNPLPIAIHDGSFRIECSGICRSLTIPAGFIDARQRCEVVFLVNPSSVGTTQITAKFNSTELGNVEGSISFEVPKPEQNESLNDVLYFQ